MKIAHTNTGEIQGVFSDNVTAAHPDHSLMRLDDKADINAIYKGQKYVDLTVNPPAIKDKLPFPAVANKTEVIADNTDEVIISRVPLGCTCTLDGEPVTVTEELITFTAEHVGTYVFNFSMFPYLDGTITITGKAKDENTGT